MASGAPDSGKENQPPQANARKRGFTDAFNASTEPLRKQVKTDPLVGHGRHFGRTIDMFCRLQTLIKNGLSRTVQLELGRLSESDFSPSEKKEHDVYRQLLALSPNLEERLCTGSEEEIYYVAEMITKGANSARADDCKSMKSAVVDWITPVGGVLSPPIQRNVKTDRGFYHDTTGHLLCPVNLEWNDPKVRRDLKAGTLIPSGDMWPRFIYRDYAYNRKNPWEGLLRSCILVSAFKHVFTSPSSVNDRNERRATRSCNARIHGMNTVTGPSIAYIATQLRFALCSASTFSRTDRVTDSEYFYNLIVDLFEDPEERDEADELLRWWNRQIFPKLNTSDTRTIHEDSVIARIKIRCRELQQEREAESSQLS